MNTKRLKRLALFRLSAIGDVVLMVPVVRALQRCYPSLPITWITSSCCYALLEGLSGVDFLVINKPRSLMDFLRVSSQLGQETYDVLLAAQASLRANLLYPCIKASRKIGFDHQRARDGHRFFVNEHIEFAAEHLVDGFMRFASALGVTDTGLEWNLPIAQSQYDWAEQQLSMKPGPWVAVNPVSSKRERMWSLDRYVSVIDQAVEKWQVNVVLTGGLSAQEQAFSSTINQKTKADCLVLTGKTSLKQMAALLRLVDLLIAPDSGPVHLATAMGTPVLGLYAVAPPELSGPYFSGDLVVNKYPEAVSTILKKNPLHLPWGKRVHSLKAMQLITVKEVMQKLSRVF